VPEKKNAAQTPHYVKKNAAQTPHVKKNAAQTPQYGGLQ
jgi:hypothetical protein